MGDNGYGYDDYKTGKKLSIDLLRKINDITFYKFYPSINSSEETGEKRGCVKITHSEEVKKHLSELDRLRNLYERQPQKLKSICNCDI